MANTDPVLVPGQQTTSSLRDQYRTQLVGNVPKPLSKVVTAFGLKIEMRQPQLGDVLNSTGEVFETTKERIADMIIKFAYIPETDERIFEAGDMEQILRWPFGKDYKAVQDALNELSGIDIDDAEKDLDANPLG